MVSVIIVQYNGLTLTKEAIKSFMRWHKSLNYEIILVDNGSKDFNRKEFVNDFPDLKIFELKKNEGFGKANNLGAKSASGEILYFLNNDTITNEEYLSKVEDRFNKDPEVGILGPRLLNPDNTYQLSHGKLPSFLREISDKLVYFVFEKKWELPVKMLVARFDNEQYTGWVTGAAMFVRKSVFEKIGGFDENFFMYFEDKELCKRVQLRGNKIIYYPKVSLVHLKGGSSGGDNSGFTQKEYRRSQMYYYKNYRNHLENVLLKIFLKITRKYPD
ncbi:MAG: glycosyltransferase family 2 protein [Ignavibacteriales bacterium]|jgi:GT2 family glycosyltransferase|nr:glycosyltransferase family 2 protein [Ignavibacteriaceae bacterium]NLH61635.1 glycosyltransferase family 2 protein [Ignavibacteriales bacterium]HOJ18800.1 glycosyltransferase family 2 protein [Ignavibacteriaceae bacterium]HPO55651.1 glycosyltransferase family 2 protein [Ignavibacteriaceae bacterium]